MSENRHDRTIGYFGEKSFARIRNTEILVIGAGATGNEAVKNLAMLGIGHVILVDFDKVSVSNLNRCVFFQPNDHRDGTPKVEAIKREVALKFPDVIVSAYDMAIEDAPEEIWRTNLVIVGVDNDLARSHINTKLLSLSHAPVVIDGAMGKDFYETRVSRPGHTACLCCLWTRIYLGTILSRQVKKTCDKFFSETVEAFPMVSFLTSYLGATIATEAIKAITDDSPIETGKYIRHDVARHEFMTGVLRKNPRCVEYLCRGTLERKNL